MPANTLFENEISGHHKCHPTCNGKGTESHTEPLPLLIYLHQNREFLMNKAKYIPRKFSKPHSQDPLPPKISKNFTLLSNIQKKAKSIPKHIVISKSVFTLWALQNISRSGAAGNCKVTELSTAPLAKSVDSFVTYKYKILRNMFSQK